jgi:hypothetical protein
MCVSDKAEISRALLSYLSENTAASDTLEGIAEWWLLDRKLRNEITAVKELLDEFVAKKFILESEAGDGRVHYRINRRKQKQIRALLEERET